MWTQPRATIRFIVHENPRYGVLYLAIAYAMQNLFYLCNLYSAGLHFTSFVVMLGILVFSPIFGMLWLYFSGWILHFTGRWLGGSAPAIHLRSAIAWSQVPAFISVAMWIILWMVRPGSVFVLGSLGSSLIIVNLVSFILGIWSFILLIQSLCEIQGFTLLRSLFNILLMGLISGVLLFAAVFVAQIIIM